MPTQRYNTLIAIVIGLLASLVCYNVRLKLFPGPGDFNWALDTARALLNRQDPYNFTPSIIRVPYPLPVALFGLPFVSLPGPMAAAIFFGLSSALLAFGILRYDSPWRLLVFLSFPYLYALFFAQWAPLIMATWFFPILAPLLVLVKPHTAIPVAANRLTRRGIMVAVVVLLVTLVIYPSWPLRWIAMSGDYQRMIPLLSLPFGPLLLLTLAYWHHEQARLLFLIAAMPFRAAYDLVALCLIPRSRQQMIAFLLLGWSVPALNAPLGLAVSPTWVIPALFLPALAMVIYNQQGFRTRLHQTPESLTQHSRSE